MSAGLLYPRFKGIPAALVTRASVFNQDWSKYSSYTEQIMGVSAGIVSDTRHDLSYNLMWRMLKDPSHMASPSVRRQLGHGLLSSLKYTFKIDERDSTFRPTKGYAIRSSSQIAGIGFQSNLIRFFRQVCSTCSLLFCFFKWSFTCFQISGLLNFKWKLGIFTICPAVIKLEHCLASFVIEYLQNISCTLNVSCLMDASISWWSILFFSKTFDSLNLNNTFFFIVALYDGHVLFPLRMTYIMKATWSNNIVQMKHRLKRLGSNLQATDEIWMRMRIFSIKHYGSKRAIRMWKPICIY